MSIYYRFLSPFFAAAVLYSVCAAASPILSNAGKDAGRFGSSSSKQTKPLFGTEGLRAYSGEMAVNGGFVENKGQVTDSEGRNRPDILFTAGSGAARLFFMRDRISYVFLKLKEAEKIGRENDPYPGKMTPDFEAESYRMDMLLQGAEPGLAVRGEGRAQESLRYYFGSPEAFHAAVYERIVYSDVYPGIDLVFMATAGGMKYEFALRPGADPSVIRLRFAGAGDVTVLGDGSLQVVNPLGEIREAAPFSYQPREPGEVFSPDMPQIRTDFVFSEGEVRFDVGQYDASMPLVIDPSVQWSTYYGGSNADRGMGIAADAAGNVVVAGYTFSTNFPVTPGAVQNINVGQMDAFVVKFNGSGVRQWATYLGGSGNDPAFSVATDGAGNVVIAGETFSTVFPTTAGAYQTQNRGIADAYVARFSPSGILLWSTLLGGSSEDNAYAVACDAAGNVVLTGATKSINFPVAGGAFQSSLSGVGDVFVSKFSPAGALLWSTFYGGSLWEAGRGAAIDASGNVVIVGGTASVNFPVSTGAFQALQGGAGDAFVIKFDGSGARLWATYCGGSQFDAAYAVATDTGRRIAVVGVTASDDLPVSPQAFRIFRVGGDEAFLFMFTPTGDRDWGTYYGGNLDDVAYGVGADVHGNIAFAGQTFSPNFPVSPDSIQIGRSGTADAFAVKFTPSGGRLWATYYGGAADEAAYGTAMQYSGNVLLTGTTSSANFPVKSAHQPFIAGAYDAFVAKLCDVKPIVRPGGPTNMCHGSSVVLDAGAGYASYLWSTSATTQTITVSTAGKYTVKVTDGLGCEGISDTIVVNIGPLLVADAGPDTSICLGSTTRIGGPVAGGVGPYAYHWTPSSTLSDSTAAFPFATPGATTKYYVTVTDAYNCVSTDSVTVTINPNPTVSAGPDTVICRGSSVVIGNPASSGTGPYSYLWSPTAGLGSHTAATPTASPSATTRYTVLVTDANGCTATDSVLVGVSRVTADAGDDKAVCSGDTVQIGGPFSITRVVPTYAWSPTTGLSASDVPRPFAFPSVTTTYVLTVTDSLGCFDRDTVIVSVFGALKALAGPDETICLGASTLIGDTAVCGTPPYDFRWRPSTGLNDTTIMRPTASPTTTTTYYLRVTDAAMSTVYDTMVVYVNNPPVANAGVDSLICRGQSVRIGSIPTTGTSPYTYKWTPPDGLSADNVAQPFALPLVSAQYVFTVTDANGCQGTDTVEIRVSDIAVDAGADRELCLGDSVQLDATASGVLVRGALSYLWTPSTGLSATNIRNPKASPATTTKYYVTVTDAKGCSATDSMVVMVNTPPSVDAGPDHLVCRMEATQIGDTATSGTPPYTYLWTPSTGLSSNRVARPLVRISSSTTYVVRVTDSKGCIARDTVNVTLLPWPNANAGPDRTICWGDSIRIGLQATGGIPPYSYKWAPVAGLSDSTAARPWARPFSPTTYTVTVTDANGCQMTDQVLVNLTLRPTPLIRVEGSLPICEGSSITMSIDSTRQYNGYRWYRDSVFIDTARRVTVSEGGGYHVEVNTHTGCSGFSPPVVVNVIPLPRPRVTASGPLTFCEGLSVVLESDSVYPWTFIWSNGVRGRRLEVTQSGEYYVTVTGANGCVNTSGTYIVTVLPKPSPVIAANGNTEFCQGGSVTLDADPGGIFKTWQWSNGASTRTITVSTTGTFTVTVTDENGCTATSPPVSVKVNPIPSPRITASGPLAFCLGNEVTLDAGAGYAQYLWSNGGNTRTIKVDYPGTFSVTVWTAAGCSATSASVTVTVNPLPQPRITALGPTNFCQGDSVRLDAGPGYSSYQWSNGRTTRIITVKTAGNFVVTVRDSLGCRGTAAAVAVTVYPAPNPVITAAGPTSFCPGDSVVLDAGAGYAVYAWSTGASTRRITVKTSGTYRVTVTNAAGCVGTSNPVTVTRYETPVPRIASNGPLRFCDGGNVELDAGAGWQSYLWSTGERTRRITVSRSGLYNVRVTNQNGCSGESDVVEVQVKPNPPIPLINQSGNTLISTPAVRFQWNFSGAPITGATQRTYNPPTNGQYTVTVWNADTCSSTSAPYDYRATGIEAMQSVASFAVFPDPNQGQVTVELQLTAPAKVRIVLADMLGRQVADFGEQEGDDGYHRRLDLRHVPDGLYFLQIHAGKQIMLRKILKQ